MKLINTAILLLIFSLNTIASDTIINTHPAERVVQQTTTDVLSILKNKQDPQQIKQLINKIILPNFNIQQMSQWALGKEWSNISKQKQTLFALHFQQLLVNTYSTALSEFGNQSISVLKAKFGKKKNIAMVPTLIEQKNATPMQIVYMMMADSDGWKVVDMSISGVSLIRNYRATYASQIRNVGFDALMAKIIQKNELARL